MPDALVKLDEFLTQKKIINSRFTFVTCGDFDLNLLRSESKKKKIVYKEYLNNYINIKK